MLDLTFKGLFLFSLPSIFSSLLEPISGVVDTALVGRLDTNWLAALAVSSIIFSSFTWMFNFLIHASTQAVASVASSKDNDLLGEKVRISLIVCLIVAILSAAFLYIFRKELYVFSGASEGLIPLIEAYFIIRVIGHPFTLLYTTLISILRGLQKVRLSFFLVLFSTLSNVLISWYLLYEVKMGIEGAAYGTIASNFIGCLFSFIFLFSEPRIKKSFFSKNISKDGWIRFGSNSADIFGRSAALSLCFYLSTKFASSLGVISLAAHQVLMQLWLICSFFTDGLAITGNILGSQLIAEKKFHQMKLFCKRLLILGAVIGFIFTMTYFLFGEQIWLLFTQDAQVIKVINNLWPLIFVSQIIMAIAYVYDGILFGMEEFSYLRFHMIIGVLIIFLPLALSLFYYQSLWPLWLGLFILGVYRGFTGFLRVKIVLDGATHV